MSFPDSALILIQIDRKRNYLLHNKLNEIDCVGRYKGLS